ncbi:hypothetical protein B0T25DRAFT_562205 [Lasiosphaeria hispida]|uniref:Uncharacterized protein n=1 Tax=Lasiosphaeria hispida TaxID=260671 RepID=A0AAJ0HV88_9PEZI|nr:hypothetical protein B0T25DRAFT_562205 [Lasiosphaeria hispida]
MANENTQSVIYNGPHDWHIWSDAIKAKASQSLLWPYFEGKPWPIEPKYPEPKDFDAVVEPSGSTSSQTTGRPGSGLNDDTDSLDRQVRALPPAPTGGIYDKNNSDYPGSHGAVLHNRRRRDAALRAELAARAAAALTAMRNAETELTA